MASTSNDTDNTVERAFVPKDAVPARIVDTIQLEFDAAAGGTWTFVSLTQDVAQIALDAVRYRLNYARVVTSRLCLHYINTIRKRVSGGLTKYLFDVDGCVSSLVEATGRCDIYYCRPYTYELQLTQKSIGSDVFIVQSIYKTVDQKTLDDFRDELSNLDWSTEIEAGIEEYPVSSPLRPFGQSEQTVDGQSSGEEELNLPTDEEEGINWVSTDIMENNFWKPPPLVTQRAATESLSLRVGPVTMASLKTEAPNTADVTIVGIIAVATVLVSTVSVVAALMVKQRTRSNTVKRAVNQAYPPLRSAEPITFSTTENMIRTDSLSRD